MRITIWNEFYAEQQPPEALGFDHDVREVYPEGIHRALARGLGAFDGVQVRTATPQEPEQGLPDDVLDATDVLFWWGHFRHADVDDAVVDRVERQVHAGMGLVLLHSATSAKVFKRVLGTVGGIHGWRHGDKEVLWTVDPAHPIARGVTIPLVIEQSEMYCEPFNIPRPDDVVFISSFSGGEVVRSGVTYQRGLGRVFFFAPGHEEFPIYDDPDVLRILHNAATWAARPSWLPPLKQVCGSPQRPAGWFERQGQKADQR